MSETFEGGCSCGAVRYRMTSGPMVVHCCHCRDCQRQTGSGFAINALIEADRVELLSGEPEAIALEGGSGRPHIVKRCPTCRIAVWSHYSGREQVSFIRVGTLDDPTALEPDVHIFTRSKLPWVGLPKDAPAYDVYYKTEDIWSPEAMERRDAVMS